MRSSNPKRLERLEAEMLAGEEPETATICFRYQIAHPHPIMDASGDVVRMEQRLGETWEDTRRGEPSI
jgi:hypothetical protein